MKQTLFSNMICSRTSILSIQKTETRLWDVARYSRPPTSQYIPLKSSPSKGVVTSSA